MEYDCLNADRLGDDAWIGAVFFCFGAFLKSHSRVLRAPFCA